jgi:hypothetical protein
VGLVAFGDDQQAGSVLVYPVDDAGALDAADARQLARAMVEQRVDQSAVQIARGGMDDKAGGFVHYDQVVVFISDGEGNILRLGIERGGGRQGDGETRASGNLDRARGGHLAVDLDLPLGDQRLDSFARDGGLWRAGLGQFAVEAACGGDGATDGCFF